MLSVAPLLIAYGAWLFFVLTWHSVDRTARTIATPPPSRERLYLLVISFGLVLFVLGPVGYPTGRLWVSPTVLDWGMLLVMGTGIAWCYWARRHLGRFWSASVTHKEGHRIIDTGPYGLVRHPMYTGMIVMDVAVAIICATPPVLLAVPVMILGLWLKARLEERFLIEELGAATYAPYQARTPMLVPSISRRPGQSLT